MNNIWSTRFLVLALLAGGCWPVAQAGAKTLIHPAYVDLGQRKPMCTDCHDEEPVKGVVPRIYNHTVYFGDNHRLEARRDPQVCNMCHKQKMCNDCHGIEIELKPSERDRTGNYRRMPHRGDYLSRHRIEGRLDPGSCYRCHGNPRRAKTCVRCHG
ncbi:MAG: cytochrome C [Proteobacteria bacterium]|nr:cytochrome C [Pseudomonadota bacterium]MBU1738836.1 cytochrome C [Pseudomonadota bacterium]